MLYAHAKLLKSVKLGLLEKILRQLQEPHSKPDCTPTEFELLKSVHIWAFKSTIEALKIP